MKTAKEQIQTAEEYFKEVRQSSSWSDNKNGIYCMIEFAKLHVEAALKEASENADMKMEKYSDDWYIDKSSILNSYPLTNIK